MRFTNIFLYDLKRMKLLYLYLNNKSDHKFDKLLNISLKKKKYVANNQLIPVYVLSPI